MRDVLVKGMKMAKTCSNCAVVRYDDNESEYYCPFSNKIAFRDSRRASCPLVELPEHGDLIDKDDVIAKFRRAIATFLPSDTRRHMKPEDSLECHGWSQGLCVVLDAPVIIPAEKGMNE